jgi:polysaccharide biosynthesis transport protein
LSEDIKHGATAVNAGPAHGTLPASREGSNVAIWQVVRKYWPTAVATTLLVVAATAFYTLGQKKIYEAEATIMFDPRPPKPLGTSVEAVVDLGADSFWSNQEYYETQYHIIQSRRVALSVVRELGLHNDPAFLFDMPEGEEAPATGKETTPELAAEVLRGRTTVTPVRDSRLATVRLRDASPKRAQRVLSALVEAYVNQNLDNAVDSTSSATDWLRGQLDGLRRDLDGSEHALHEYKKKNDILSVAFDDKSSMLLDEMKDISGELTRVNSQLKGAAARQNELRATPDDDPDAIESNVLLQSPLLNQLRAEHHAAVRRHDALLSGPKGANHPEVLQAADEVKTLEKSILREVRNIKKAAMHEVRELAGHAGGLDGDLKAAKKQAHELNLLEIEYNNLRRTKDNTEKLYSLVLERTKEADLTQMMRVNNISVVDEPLEPTYAVYPRVPLNMAMGLFLGLVLGGIAAFMRGMLDRTLKIPDDVEDELGLSCLGLLPAFTPGSQKSAAYPPRRKRGRAVEATGAPELVVHEEPMSSVAEAARAIRTNLMFMAPDNPHRVLLVTSAGPSEGKTTVACCIAIAMAQAGQRVALIDCDLRRPRIHRIFKTGSSVGVTTALLDGKFDEIVKESGVPDLSVLAAGPIPPNPAELFHSERFKTFLETARSKFDRVIIDSPPVAAVTDPTVLSKLVDGTVLVVRAFKTRRDIARHAVRLVQSVGGNLAGVVLNAVDFSRMEYKYSHYYYYRREGYYSSEPTNRLSVPSPPSSSAGDNPAAPPS